MKNILSQKIMHNYNVPIKRYFQVKLSKNIAQVLLISILHVCSPRDVALEFS